MVQMKVNQDKNTAHITPLSDKVMYERFAKDFQSECIDLELLSPNESPNAARHVPVSCTQMSKLFLNLGFVRQQTNEEEQIALANIWKTIGGDGQGEQTVPL